MLSIVIVEVWGDIKGLTNPCLELGLGGIQQGE
jgi:hypothetical protein